MPCRVLEFPWISEVPSQLNLINNAELCKERQIIEIRSAFEKSQRELSWAENWLNTHGRSEQPSQYSHSSLGFLRHGPYFLVFPLYLIQGNTLRTYIFFSDTFCTSIIFSLVLICSLKNLYIINFLLGTDLCPKIHFLICTS